MLAALPLIEAGAVAIIGAVAGATVTRKVIDRIENRSKTKSPRRRPKERPSSSRISAIGDSDSDSDFSSLHSEGSAYGQRSRQGPRVCSRAKDFDHYVADQIELDEEHILRLMRLLPRRRSRIGALIPADRGRRSRGSKWRALSPYATEGDDPVWVQQGYKSHREWYEDLDAESKEAYLGYLFDLLKQARKKTLDDLEESATRRRRGDRRSLYAIVEKHALFEKREEQWQQPRPHTPAQEYTDPRTRSWVNTQHPTQTSLANEPGVASAPPAPDFGNQATGPYLNIPPSARAHQPANHEDGEVLSEPASSEEIGSNDGDFSRGPRTNTSRARQPRSRSVSPYRERRRPKVDSDKGIRCLVW